MQIALPRPSRLSQKEQFALLQQVADPAPDLRLRRARLAIGLDRFAEACADLEAIPAADRPPLATILLAQARRQLAGDAEHQVLALLAPIDAEALPADVREMLRLEQAACLRKLGERDNAIAVLQSALAQNPHSVKVVRKLMAMLFDARREADALAVAEGLMRQGIANTRVIGSAFTALAALGRRDEAVALRGLDRFLCVEHLAGDDLPALHDAVEAELRAHPALRFGNSRQASEGSWRVDELALREQSALTRLLDRIRDKIARQVAQLQADPDPHPWLDQMPERGQLAAWAILAPAEGRETWHTHDGGWLSGVYYTSVPAGLPHGDDPAGAIEFGWTDNLLGESTRQQLPARIVHPSEGMLLLFPSHVHHRTYPHGQAEDRICIAFDVMPAS